MLALRWILAAAVAFAYVDSEAQIYQCTAPDGTKVFSDERCGKDAKLVPGITSKKRSNGSSAAKSAPVPPKSKAELDALLKSCDQGGDLAACNAWAKGGGPGQLRDDERKATTACESGSLADCEQRYCQEGMTAQCRERILQSAQVSGENWYLRDQRKIPDGPTSYSIRCIREGERQPRDAIVTCDSAAAPDRCRLSQDVRAFARLDLAAVSYCRR